MMTDTCADCGSPNAVVPDTDGRLCRPCQDKRNDALADTARTLGPVCQQIDPDGPPESCGMADCTRDATHITRINTKRGLVGVTACDEHIPAMVNVVAQMLAVR